MIDRGHVLMFVTESRQKLHRYDQIAGGGVFEILGKCSLAVMTPCHPLQEVRDPWGPKSYDQVGNNLHSKTKSCFGMSIEISYHCF